jgi:hypothetical protein
MESEKRDKVPREERFFHGTDLSLQVSGTVSCEGLLRLRLPLSVAHWADH